MRRAAMAGAVLAVLAAAQIIRQPGQNAALGQFTIPSVAGLVDELNVRTRKAIGYLPSRAIRTDANGDLSAIVGQPDDCVHVDGTSGACGSGGVGSPTRYGDTLAGTLDGSNAAFTLTSTPVAGSARIYRNGIRLRLAVDYTISGAAVTFLSGAIPQSGDILQADYEY